MDNQEYWAEVGETWEKHTGNPKGRRATCTTNPTHFQRWANLRHTWKHILPQSEEEYGLARERWDAFGVALEAHAQCPTRAMCGACGAGYCSHLHSEHIFLSHPVCTACDAHCFPNPYNPRCRWLVEYFARALVCDQDLDPSASPSLSALLADGRSGAEPSGGQKIEPASFGGDSPNWCGLGEPGWAEVEGDISITVDTPPLHDFDLRAADAGSAFPKVWGWN